MNLQELAQQGAIAFGVSPEAVMLLLGLFVGLVIGRLLGRGQSNPGTSDKIVPGVSSKGSRGIQTVKQGFQNGSLGSSSGTSTSFSSSFAKSSITINGQTMDLDPSVLANIRTLVAQGNKIEAIKELREATSLGLKESKDIIDALERVNL